MPRIATAFVLLAALAALAPTARAADSNTAPDPYHAVAGWPTLPEGRHWGQVIGIKPDRDGKSIWVFDRCGDRYCTDSKLDPIQEFDAGGKLMRSFGAGLFVFQHGLYVDRDGNVWATDADGAAGKGQQVIKFSPDGKVLMTLGQKGVAGEGPDTFNKPTDVVVAPDGDIFVSDGHGNSRIVKFGPDGKFIKAWGKKGSGPGEFDTPHGMALDAKGRLLVADRGNNRIQLFDQDGNFLTEWRQFGRPSDVYIDKGGKLYVSDSESNDKSNPGYKRGIRVGDANDGTVTAFIPVTAPYSQTQNGVGFGTGAEGVAADDAGNVYGGETTEKTLVKYAK
jgi:sugar lactone lactonase YvrE